MGDTTGPTSERLAARRGGLSPEGLALGSARAPRRGGKIKIQKIKMRSNKRDRFVRRRQQQRPPVLRQRPRTSWLASPANRPRPPHRPEHSARCARVTASARARLGRKRRPTAVGDVRRRGEGRGVSN